jgi:phosphoglycolate phosphatase
MNDQPSGERASTPISLVCLDMAGTTVDDGSAVMESFEAAADHVGLSGDDRAAAMKYVLETMGQSKIEVFRAILGDHDLAQVANREFERAYDEFVAAGRLHAMAGADEVFDWCAERSIAVCLTTGFAPPTRDAILDHLGWIDRVDLVLSPADAGRGRPYPDMILTAVIRLGIDDVRSVAVAGDTSNDLWAGHRSGASIVAGVLSGAHDRATLESAPHTHLLESVAHLPNCLPESARSR